jgi:hypothetical protein
MEARQHTECKFLEGSATGLGVEKVDDAELEEDPATVDGQVSPLDGIESNRVDVGGEETGELSEDLLNTDTTASHRVGPEFNQVGYKLLDWT